MSKLTIQETIKEGDVVEVKKYLESGKDPSHNVDGISLLHLACIHGKSEVAQFLISEGATVNAKNKAGFTPLHCANTLETVKLLVANGADINATTVKGITPFYNACTQNSFEIAEFLLNKGASIAKIAGTSPLHLASFHGNLELVKLLVKHEVDINEKDGKGRTPLHIATMGEFPLIVQFLIQSGASLLPTAASPFSQARHLREASYLPFPTLSESGSTPPMLHKTSFTPVSASSLSTATTPVPKATPSPSFTSISIAPIPNINPNPELESNSDRRELHTCSHKNSFLPFNKNLNVPITTHAKKGLIATILEFFGISYPKLLQEYSELEKCQHCKMEAIQKTKFETDSLNEKELTAEIEQFEAEMERCKRNSIHEKTTGKISPSGGCLTLDGGASLKIRPGSSTTGRTLSVSTPPIEVVNLCKRHDSLEGSKLISVLDCGPHGEEFSKPVLLQIPYDKSIPVEKLAVFHMNADSSGQPTGVWTMVEEAKFDGSVVTVLTTHFSYFSVFEFEDKNFQNKAKLRRSKNKFNLVYPGLTFRGPCKNSRCVANGKHVNCSMGFGEFDISDEVLEAKGGPTRIGCPMCNASFVPEELVLHDTVATMSFYKILDSDQNRTEIIDDTDAVCLRIKKTDASQLEWMKNFVVKCTPRAESIFGIDICFVIDCTGSMEEYIEAVQIQVAGMAQQLKGEVKKLGMGCKVRVGFVAYRDFEIINKKVQVPDDIVYSVDFTEDIDKIIEEVAAQHAHGGGDQCEYLEGGIKEALELSWEGSMRAIVLVTDAPCHGKEFHGNAVDDFPDGIKDQHPRKYLKKMIQKNINFFFLKIKDSTDTMIKKFRVMYDHLQENTKGTRITVLPMGQEVNLMSKLIEGGIMREINGLY